MLQMNEVLSCERARNSKYQKVLYRGLIKHILFQSEMDWDYLIVVDGLEGSGKSSCALNLASDLDSDVLNNVREHVVWEGKEFTNLVYKLDPSAIIDDEIGLDLFNRQAMTKESRRLVKMLMIMREKRHIPILVMPNMWWMDNYIIHHRAQLWIHVDYKPHKGKRLRGFASVHRPVRNLYKRFTFWAPTFTYRFPDIPEEIKEEYLDLKAENSRSRAFEEDSINIKGSRDEIITNLYQSGKFTQRELARAAGLTQGQVSKIIKEVVT